jgi:hypothetical protein
MEAEDIDAPRLSPEEQQYLNMPLGPEFFEEDGNNIESDPPTPGDRLSD